MTIQLYQHWKKSALFFAACGVLAFGSFAYFSRDGVAFKGQALDIFDMAFAPKYSDRVGNPLLRIRTGTEIFCIQEDASTPISVRQLIVDLSTTFDLQWTQDIVKDLSECSEDTTFYVLHDKHLDQSKVSNLLFEIVGSAPPELDKLFPDDELGFNTTLPGIGNRVFVFIRLREDVPNYISRSIMSEEILQATLSASDVTTSRIISLLGENVISDDYSLWFDHNPAGFCSLDILLMELLLGSSMPAHLTDMKELRDYMSSAFEELVDTAELRGQALYNYADPRCWIWQAPS